MDISRRKTILEGFCILVCFLLLAKASTAAPRDRDLYLSAKKDYDVLSKRGINGGNRPRWEALLTRFQKIHREMPRSRYADDALFHEGKIYRDLYVFDENGRLLELALNSWGELLRRYPGSHWAAETLYGMGLLFEESKKELAEAKKHYQTLIETYPGGPLALKAQGRLEEIKKAEEEKSVRTPSTQVTLEKPLLKQIRFTSSKAYTRVTMYLSTEVRYETHRLKDDPSKGLPPRIYVDLVGAQLGMDSMEPIVVQDGLLRQVRVGQFSPEVVRVVLDMSSLRDHRTFLLADPYRLVIDIQGQRNGDALAAIEREKALPAPLKGKKPPSLGLRKIVLDPGHGGKDPGAIGVGGIAEKDIVLSIAKKLARKLKRDLGVEVVLTRQDDTFVPLEDRTAIANAEEADLFISLHTNASPKAEAKGLETYYLDNTNDEGSLRLAARENGTSRKSISDLQFILSDLTQNLKLEDSITLAHRIHGSLIDSVGQRHGQVRDLGVKKALFYVLVGARMPSVLVEIFFITNKSDARLVTRESNQNSIVEALYHGIKKYNESVLATKTL